jgi:hypothetical protein
MSPAARKDVVASDRAERSLLSRRGFVARQIMRQIMVLDVGSRIPGTDQFAREYSVGFGTVGEALDLIVQAGAATFRRRGAQGTFLESLDWPVAWSLAGLPSVIGSLPLPYTKRYEGLATALHALLGRAGTPTTLSYMRGAARRLDAVATGHADFAVTSAFSADHFAASAPDAVSIVLRLPAQTFVREHGLVFAEPERTRIRPGDRLGVDRDSLDQTLLTDMEIADVGRDVTLLDVPYGHILDALARGEIDAAVWNTEEIVTPGLSVQPLHSAAAHTLRGSTTQAALVVRSGDDLSSAALIQGLTERDIVRIQAAVLSGERQARY